MTVIRPFLVQQTTLSPGIPMTRLIRWPGVLLVGNPMNLAFTAFEVMAVALSVAVVTVIALDGESNWLEGAQLLAVYGILAAAFFFF